MRHLLFLLITVIWATSFLLMKKGMLAFGPVSIGALRVFGGALALGLIWRVRGGAWPFIKRDFLPLLALVLVGYAWPYCLQPFLVARNGSGFIGMSMVFVPLMTILVSIPLLRVFPTPLQFLGVLGGLGLVGLLMWDALQRSDVNAADLPLMLSVPFTYALTNTYIKLRFAGVPSLALAATELALASVVLLPVAAFLPAERAHFLANLGADHFALAAGSVAALGILGTGIAMYMFYKLIQDHGPLFAGMVTYLIPTGALVLGWFDGEAVTAKQLGALAGIFVMVALVQFGHRQEGQSHKVSEPST